MPDRRLATICVYNGEEDSSSFPRHLDHLLATLPVADVELRLALPRASDSASYALGRLCPDGRAWQHALLPQGIERFQVETSLGLPVVCWCFPGVFPVVSVWRWLWCDLAVATDYLVWLEDAASWAEDCWQELSRSFHGGGDVFGPPLWQELSDADVAAARLQPWYRGLPFATRAGRAGVWVPAGGWAAFRVSRVRESSLLETRLPRGSEDAFERVFFWLGAAAQQLEWRFAVPAPSASSPAGPDDASASAAASPD
jgi:hypothetical protein